MEQPRGHDQTRHRTQSRAQPPQAARRCGNRRRGRGRGVPDRNRSRSGRTGRTSSPDPLTTPPVAGLHLQFGADASSEMVVSWHTLQSVRNPRVMLGSLDGRLDRVVAAKETSYTDAKSGQVVYAYHAKIGQLQANSAYLYGAYHEDAAPEFGTFRTAPRGRARFTFTSFGDQATPTLGKKYKPPEGVTIAEPAICERQSRLAGGCRYGSRRGAAAALVSPAQRRSLLRQYGRGSGADLVGFLGEQQPQRPQASLDAGGRQPRERARQRADRLSGLPDLLLTAGGRRPHGCDTRAVVRLHRRLDARDQPRQ